MIMQVNIIPTLEWKKVSLTFLLFYLTLPPPSSLSPLIPLTFASFSPFLLTIVLFLCGVCVCVFRFNHRQRPNYDNVPVGSSYQRRDPLAESSRRTRIVEIPIPNSHTTPPKTRGIGGGIKPGSQSLENMFVPGGASPRRRRRTLEHVPNGVNHNR